MPTPYTKQTWNDNDARYPISAVRMNHIEDGIAQALIYSGIVVIHPGDPVPPGTPMGTVIVQLQS